MDSVQKMNKDMHKRHDKGYKELYSNKEVLLDLLNNLLHLEWAADIVPEDLTLVDKSYVTSDYSELESDLVYRMRIGDTDAIVYVLMELQSTDYRMPVRLMFYMEEILREYMKEAAYSASNSTVHIPAVFPIVLYNGEKPWNAGMTLREITDGGDRLGESLLDFRYSLIDINHAYTEEELLNNDCISSVILLLDRRGDMQELLNRLGQAVVRFRSLTDGKNREIITHWLSKTANPLIAGSAAQILNADVKEAKAMLDNIALAYESGLKKAEEAGAEKGRVEGEAKGRAEGEAKGRAEGEIKERRRVAHSLKTSGMEEQKIAELLRITKEEVWQLLK